MIGCGAAREVGSPDEEGGGGGPVSAVLMTASLHPYSMLLTPPTSGSLERRALQ